MAKAKGKRREKPPSYEQACKLLPQEISKREQMLGDYYSAYSAFHAAHDDLTARFQAMGAADQSLKAHQALIDKLRAIVDGGPAPVSPVVREVDAPLMTDAEFLHQKELDPETENIGKSKVLFSMDQFIGGFSRYPNRKPHHEMAAARFLSLYERSQLGGAGANDMSQPYVDRSGPTAGGVVEAGAIARRDYAEATKFLGQSRSSLLEMLIVGRVSTRTIAAQRLGKSKVGGKQVAIVAQEVWDAIEALARHFALATPGPANSSPR